MPVFHWSGIQHGKPAEGTEEAETLEQATSALQAQGVILTSLEEAGATPKKRDYNPRQIKLRDLMIFTKKFSTMVEAGLPMLKTLSMLEDQSDNPHLKKVLTAIRSQVEAGATLSEAFARHPKVFDTLYINLLQAGEASGKLPLFLKRLVVQLEKMDHLRRKVKGAMTYPVILLVVAFVVILIMMIKVVPVFQNMFGTMGHALPGPTALIISVSEFIREPARGGVVGLVLIGLFVAVKILLKTHAGFRWKFHGALLKLPLLGDILQTATLARIAMIQGNLFSAGVPVLQTLDIIASTMQNDHYRAAMEQVRSGVEAGQNLSALYGASPLFPPTFTQMLEVGEETGNMEAMLEAVARYYEESFDMKVDQFTELLEPLMIVFMGLTIGFIIVAMYMPIFQVGQMVGGA